MRSECGRGAVWTAPGKPRAVIGQKIFLVTLRIFVEVMVTMNRTYTLIVLLGLVVCGLLTGCNDASKDPTPPSTNAPASGTMSTNK